MQQVRVCAQQHGAPSCQQPSCTQLTRHCAPILSSTRTGKLLTSSAPSVELQRPLVFLWGAAYRCGFQPFQRWEARRDAGSGMSFFIDHEEKKTYWEEELPAEGRAALQTAAAAKQQQQQQQQQQQPRNGALMHASASAPDLDQTARCNLRPRTSQICIGCLSRRVSRPFLSVASAYGSKHCADSAGQASRTLSRHTQGLQSRQEEARIRPLRLQRPGGKHS